MPRYDFDVPRSRGLTDTNDCLVPENIKEYCVKDFILHMLLARVTTEGGDTVEFETIFNPVINALEIDVPEEILEVIESINVGPNLQRFLDWFNGLSDVVFDTIQLNPDMAAPAHSEGLLYYDRVNKAVAIYNSEEDITLQVGQELWLPVHNHSGSTITNGQAVRLSSTPAQGWPSVELAQADAEGTSFVIGLATHDIEHTDDEGLGFITTFGIVRDVDTSAFTAGDRLWLSPAAAGGLTNVKPSPPDIETEIGIVVISGATDGQIFVNPRFANYYTKDQIDNIIANLELGELPIPNLLRVVLTAGTGGDHFTSTEEAIDEINSFIGGPNEATADNRYVIQIAPGTYTENNPLIVPSYVSIQGYNADVSILRALNSDQPLLITSDDSQLYNLKVIGPTDAGVPLILVGATSAADIARIVCDDGSVGIQSDGAGTSCLMEMSKFRSGIGTSILATDSGIINCFNITSNASETHFYANGGRILIGSALGASGTNVLYANNGGEISASMVTGVAHTNFVRVNNASSISLANGVSHFLATWDVLQEDSSEIFLSFCRFNATKLSFADSSTAFINFVSDVEGDEGFLVQEELQVGRPETGRESVMGEGDSYTRGMMVHTHTGAAWADVSTAAASITGSTFTFTGIAANHAIYISTDLQVDGSGDYLKFLGIKATQTTAAVLGAGNFIVEYYSTAAGDWAELNVMATNANNPYDQYGEAIFERADSVEQIRFDDILDDWGTNDPPTTGTDRYWIRLRIENIITTAPVFQQFKIHTNRTEINADGFVEYMGEARPRRTLEAINIGNTIPVVGKSPGNNVFRRTA